MGSLRWALGAVGRLSLTAGRGAGDDALFGVPFTEQEIHQLAFGLPEQWLGIINRERWRAHGAAVMRAWTERLRADRAFHEAQPAGSETPPARPEPWPVAFYGRPDG